MAKPHPARPLADVCAQIPGFRNSVLGLAPQPTLKHLSSTQALAAHTD